MIETTPRETVAALFVDAKGVYSMIEGVDIWGEERDARKYDGPFSVVAHPPCQRWGALAKANFARWGGEHNMPGNDGGCFAAALRAVEMFGGVLEHPAKSMAWEAFSINRPSRSAGWVRTREGWTCEVWQSAYGHMANKATWLYYVGNTPPASMRWGRPKGTHQVGFQDKRGKARNKPTLSRLQANATPLVFALDLVELARNTGGHR